MAASGGAIYLDSSALVKLVLREPESDALGAELGRFAAHVTSVIGAIELQRAVRRAGLPPAQAEAVLARVGLVALDESVREQAMLIGDPLLRTLDAIHLATAISIAGELDGFACYDTRLAGEAARAGLTVLAPA